MALKGRRSRLFRRKPDMLLIDERVSTIVLPALPTDHVFVDDEEDELLYAEEADSLRELRRVVGRVERLKRDPQVDSKFGKGALQAGDADAALCKRH